MLRDELRAEKKQGKRCDAKEKRISDAFSHRCDDTFMVAASKLLGNQTHDRKADARGGKRDRKGINTRNQGIKSHTFRADLARNVSIEDHGDAPHQNRNGAEDQRICDKLFDSFHSEIHSAEGREFRQRSVLPFINSIYSRFLPSIPLILNIKRNKK